MASGPYVSVIVYAYRRRQYLLDAVRSVLAQDVDRSLFEVVVVKDFTDPEIDAELARGSPTVRVITGDLRVTGEMLSTAVEQARGEVICFLDDDDRFRPGKVGGIAELFRSDPSLGFVRNGSLAITAQGEPLPSWDRISQQPRQSFDLLPSASPSYALRKALHFRAQCNTSLMSFRAGALRPWLPYLRRIPAAQDSFLFFLATMTGMRIHVEASRWNDYRFHPSAGHSMVGEAGTQAHLVEFLRHLPTAQIMQEALHQHPGHRLAARFAECFELENTAEIFLLDPKRTWSLDGWLRLGRSAVWRREMFIGLYWALSAYRALRPVPGSRLFQRRLAGYHRRIAEVDDVRAPAG